MSEQQRCECIAKRQQWDDLSELLRLHRDLVKGFYQSTGRVFQEQFKIKRLRLAERLRFSRLAVS